jgi:16S rRNA processing protein RimM
MDKKDFFFLGTITKTSGFKGDLMFFFDVDDITIYKDLEAVFVDITSDLVPFAIQCIRIKSDRFALVHLSDVDTNEQASALVGSELYLPLNFLQPLKGNRFYFHEVTGFKVKDRKSGEVGKIEYIMDQSSQPIFVIKRGGKEILIPATDSIIKKVDRKKKVIEIEAPEGLIDIYL